LKAYSRTSTTNPVEIYTSDKLRIGQIIQRSRPNGVTPVRVFMGLIIQDVANNLNVGKGMKTNPYQISQASSLLLPLVESLKVQDLKLCFDKGLRGEYGELFDRFDVEILARWIRQYTAEQIDAVDEHRILTSQKYKDEHKAIDWALSDDQLEKLSAIGKEGKVTQQEVENGQEVNRLVQGWLADFDKLRSLAAGGQESRFVTVQVKGNPVKLNVDEYLNYRFEQEKKEIE
jgi:hypothetical protein